MVGNMKKKNYSVFRGFTLLLLLSVWGRLYAQQNLGFSPSAMGTIHQMRVYDDTLFVASGKGVYAYPLKTKTRQWEMYYFENIEILDFVKNDRYLLAFAKYGGSDGADPTSQQKILLYDQDNKTVSDHTPEDLKESLFFNGQSLKPNGMSQSTSDPNMLFMVVPDYKDSHDNSRANRFLLKKSTDFGNHWETCQFKTNEGMSDIELPADGTVFLSPFDPNSGIICGWVRQKGQYLARTNDLVMTLGNGVETFKADEKRESGSIEGLAFHPQDRNLVMSYGGNGIARSTDGGENWIFVSDDSPYRFVSFDEKDPDKAYAICENEDQQDGMPLIVYESDDKGVTWRELFRIARTGTCPVNAVRYHDSVLFATLFPDPQRTIQQDEIIKIDLGGYHPLVIENRHWFYNVKDNGQIAGRVDYSIRGSVQVDGNPCRKLFSTSTSGGVKYVGALYEDDRRVSLYYDKDGHTEKILLYDFNLQVGDELPEGCYAKTIGDFRVIRRDMIMIPSTGRSTLRLILKAGDKEITWIEGIGSETGWFPVQPVGDIPFFILEDMAAMSFDSCNDSNVPICTIHDFVEISTGILSLSSPNMTKPSLYDLNGRRIKGVPQKGVYIQNGRKVVVK